MPEKTEQFDFFQRWNDGRLGIRAATEALQARMWTSLPVKVIEPGYDAATQTITVQSTIMGRVLERGDDGKTTWKDKPYPVMSKVPVEFPTGGGLSITFPIKVGDEGVVSFQARAIDNWWAEGAANGPKPVITSNGVGSLRQHNLSDGIFRPGARSKPKALQNVSADSVQIRTDAGTAYIQFKGDEFKVVFPGGKVFRIDSNANVYATGEVTRGFGTGDQVTVGQHVHAQGNDSHGDAEVPVNPPTAGT